MRTHVRACARLSPICARAPPLQHGRVNLKPHVCHTTADWDSSLRAAACTRACPCMHASVQAARAVVRPPIPSALAPHAPPNNHHARTHPKAPARTRMHPPTHAPTAESARACRTRAGNQARPGERCAVQVGGRVVRLCRMKVLAKAAEHVEHVRTPHAWSSVCTDLVQQPSPLSMHSPAVAQAQRPPLLRMVISANLPATHTKLEHPCHPPPPPLRRAAIGAPRCLSCSR